jgi:hypothetical protein
MASRMALRSLYQQDENYVAILTEYRLHRAPVPLDQIADADDSGE